MTFDRPQFEPAAWLQMPFLRLGHDAELAKLRTASAPGFSGLGPFRLTRIDAGQCTFGKNERYLEPELPRLALVTEYRYPESADRLRALENGDVDLVGMVPPRQLKKVAAMEGVRLVEITRPRVHLIQFNLQRRELRNRTLRRAIDYAINRDAIFTKVQQPINEKNRPISGPLPFGSFGYNEKIEPRPYDRFLAKALVVGVRKELQTLPPLKLAHSGDETSRVACEMIVENLRTVGLNVSLVDLDADPSFPPGTADLRYQSYVVTDPIYDVVTLLTRDNPSLSEHGSPWFRQKLVELVDVPNLSVASDVLPELLRILHEDMVLLPLWQWTDHFAVSNGVSNLPEGPANVYQGITEWMVTPRQPPSYLQPAVASGP
jgi:ABC-type transport system substrate-binding protein